MWSPICQSLLLFDKLSSLTRWNCLCLEAVLVGVISPQWSLQRWVATESSAPHSQTDLNYHAQEYRTQLLFSDLIDRRSEVSHVYWLYIHCIIQAMFSSMTEAPRNDFMYERFRMLNKVSLLITMSAIQLAEPYMQLVAL